MNDDGSRSRSNKYPALFRAEYLLPTIMKGILTKHIPLNPEAERSLHTVISEMEPDIALLCCANIAREIYIYEKNRELDLALLGVLSEKIIKEFRPVCKLAETNPAAREAKLQALLPRLAERMEKLMDNLALTKVALEIYDANAAEILDILLIQLQGQFLIVDQLIELRTDALLYEDALVDDGNMLPAMAGIQVEAQETNIIPFRPKG